MDFEKPLFGYMGGKTKIAGQIVPHIPNHKIYIEPFFGSGGIMMKKGYIETKNKDHYREVINDVDSNITNFYEQLRSNPNELYDYIQKCEYSDALHQKAKTNSEYFKKASDLERAGLIFFNILSSYAYRTNGAFSYSKTGANMAITFNKKSLLIKEFAERFKHCYIFNRDWKWIVEKWDDENSFFYFDPPYEKCIGYDGNKNGVGKIDYDEMFNILHNIKGQWILSHYYGDFVKKFEDLGYKIVFLVAKATIEHIKGGTHELKEDKRECIVLNIH